MRFIRLAALVGSVVLIVATTVWMITTRSDLRRRDDARVVAASQLAGTAASATVGRAVALVEAATAATDPERLVGSFAEGVSSCVVADRSTCTGADLLALAGFEEAIARSTDSGSAGLAVDEADDSLLIASRVGSVNEAVPAAAAGTVVVRLPAAALVDAQTDDAIAASGAVAAVHFSPLPAGGPSGAPQRADGQAIAEQRLALPGDAGSIIVRASVDDEVGIAGDGLPLYLVLLALGTILIGLAGWTFLLDRRVLERRATTDELTGLANRREFERQTDDALLNADRFNSGLCVMLIDLNGFKQINDTLGHHVGDRVLQRAAARLRSAVRETDLVARWGGDEFVILLPGLDGGTGVRSSAERVGQALAGAPIVDDVIVTAAIGAALFPQHGRNLDELVHAADVAMYGAKTTGVTYRLADALDTELAQPVVALSGYVGPDRRRSPG